MSSLIEQELWRIFTFYALHGDPMQPENLRPAHFLRFCKDCQILSKKLNPTVIELEVSRLARAKSNSSEFNPSITINFADFLQLLDNLAQKVYSKDDPELAVKRLLLENILLLCNRRVPTNDIYDLNNYEATKLVQDVYGRSLHKIFEYFLDIASKRRNHALTAEKMQQRDLRASTNRDLAPLAMSKAITVQQLKDKAKTQKDFIAYREYVQFCHDFSLKSTSLLTAIQVGEVFLNLVPLNTETKSESGMSFDLFCQAIIYMALVAHRDADPRITSANKVKAILLYMWKAVNDSEKTMKLVSNNRANTLSQFAGSLNVFGSGAFSDQFLSNWLKDGFIDYGTHIFDDGEKSGAAMVKAVISEGVDGKEIPTKQSSQSEPATPANNDHKKDQPVENVLESLQKNLNLSTIPKASNKRTNSVLIKHFSSSFRVRNTDRISSQAEDGKKITGNVELDGSKLNDLLRFKPELSEFLYMEIENMKLSLDPVS